MKSNKHFFVFIFSKARGGISAGAYFISYNGGFVDADAFTCRSNALSCAAYSLERALTAAQAMGCSDVTVCADESALESLKESCTKLLRRFSRVSFKAVSQNPAEKLTDAVFLKRMGW